MYSLVIAKLLIVKCTHTVDSFGIQIIFLDFFFNFKILTVLTISDLLMTTTNYFIFKNVYT